MSQSFLRGVAFLGIVALLVAGVVAMYTGSFRDTVRVVVQTDRAGVTMAPGAAVKVRGVQVGRVESVDPRGQGATIAVGIDADKVRWVGKDTTAQIVPPTAFGAKHLELQSTRPVAGQQIAAGDVIHTDAVTVEVNEAFVHLAEVLSAAEPAQVNNTLTAVAGALNGHGNQLGRLISTTDNYLSTLNAALPALEADLRRADDAVKVYDQSREDLISLARHLDTTVRTLNEREGHLEKATAEAARFSRKTRPFVLQNDEPLVSLLALLDPTSRILKRYSPMLPCTFGGTAHNNTRAVQVVGGAMPGIKTYVRFQPARVPYQQPENLPHVGDDLGPNCYGLPTIEGSEFEAPKPDMGTGVPTDATSAKPPEEELATTFFGALAGLLGRP